VTGQPFLGPQGVEPANRHGDLVRQPLIEDLDRRQVRDILFRLVFQRGEERGKTADGPPVLSPVCCDMRVVQRQQRARDLFPGLGADDAAPVTRVPKAGSVRNGNNGVSC